MRTYLSVVGFARTEQRIQRVIPRDDETSNVDKEFAGNVEEDQKEVDANKAEESVDFRHRSLLLEVVENRILRKLWRKRYQHSLNKRFAHGWLWSLDGYLEAR